MQKCGEIYFWLARSFCGSGDAESGLSSPVNDQILEVRSSGGFSGGKEKVKNNFFFQRKIFEDFFFKFFVCLI